MLKWISSCDAKLVQLSETAVCLDDFKLFFIIGNKLLPTSDELNPFCLHSFIKKKKNNKSYTHSIVQQGVF